MSSRIGGLVSVVIPVYNAQRFLRETVESVRSQTYSQWELLLVDDGSRDESPAIAQEYARMDTRRIRYVQHPGHVNRGVCSTRNAGIAVSRGEFLAFLDADDIWLPHKLENQVGLLHSHADADVTFGPSVYFEEGAGKRESVRALAPSNRIYEPPDLLKQSYPIGPAGAPCPSSVFARAEAIEKIGGFEESFDTLQVYEDQVFLAKVYVNLRVFVAGESLDRYRCHEGSCWQRALQDGSEPRVRHAYLDWLQRYLRDRNIADGEVWSAIRRLTFPFRHPVLDNANRSLRSAVKRVLRKQR